MVEADRGEDLGVVVAIAPADSPLSVSIYAASALSMRMTDSDFTKKILRIATMQERGDLPFKKQQEMILLEVCRDRARDLHALAITLVDAEYQFDRNKLVLHYTASRLVYPLPHRLFLKTFQLTRPDTLARIKTYRITSMSSSQTH